MLNDLCAFIDLKSEVNPQAAESGLSPINSPIADLLRSLTGARDMLRPILALLAAGSLPENTTALFARDIIDSSAAAMHQPLPLTRNNNIIGIPQIPHSNE